MARKVSGLSRNGPQDPFWQKEWVWNPVFHDLGFGIRKSMGGYRIRGPPRFSKVMSEDEVKNKIKEVFRQQLVDTFGNPVRYVQWV